MARKPKLDTLLAEAVDTARLSLAEIAGESEIGEHLGVTAEGERLVTHRFISHKKGYQGWTWFATLARVPRAKAKDLTVCEVGIIAGEDSLLAPAWVPWADRLAKEEIEAAEAEHSAVEGEQPTEAETSAAAQDEQGSEQPQAIPEGEADAVPAQDELATDEVADEEELQSVKSPARRQVRRRRTAQRTAARRRAAQRNRARKDG
ncbi:hypothetical protein AA310_03615 [Arthrobacter sp. YC-RL1]|uniref:DUF3027 domain-containing protein n=1 Tax=Glutamicibacter soli TaxID=453836 RepID=A0A365YKH9_9MICC|nr:MULTISPECIES: DUF3027 domain-containing protein [Micrococcaceae]ALQ31778.1 hypothetical protein ATC04_15280 [Arthrobacter sp. YC-RL1]KLI89764.1 hypothetical protein AA310_03615 [Arthrobacter sp. YC-RL1]RBM03049.1 DUF3027 domain-containing protein [Glutamicibacter soli]RKS21148.1 hypothetical protein DFO58_1705 [Arthrobacter sp. AG1021]